MIRTIARRAAIVETQTATPDTLRHETANRATFVPADASVPGAVRDAWRCRHVLLEIGRTAVTLPYQQTILGPLWIPITVLMSTIGYALIFGALLNMPSALGIPYFLFLLVGMLGWTVFNRSLIYTLRSFHRYRRVTDEVHIPLLLIPIAATAQGLLEWGFYALFVLGAFAFYWIIEGSFFIPLTPQVVFGPLALLWVLALAWATGLVTGPIFTRARDIRFIIRLAMPFILFATPIIYPLEDIDGVARTVAQINPLTTIFELMKYGMLDSGIIEPVALAWSIVFTILVVVSGIWFVSRWGMRVLRADRFEEEIGVW